MPTCKLTKKRKVELTKLYYEWLVGKIFLPEAAANYSKLFKHLWNQQYYFVIDMDCNRKDDGYALRYKFIRETEVDREEVLEALNDHQPSVLEVLYALAWRCEDSIMHDYVFGDRTSRWFIEMLMNMGIFLNNRMYDEDTVQIALNRLMSNTYGPDGSGGPYYVPNPRRDMRDVELWVQMGWYAMPILEEDEKNRKKTGRRD